MGSRSRITQLVDALLADPQPAEVAEEPQAPAQMHASPQVQVPAPAEPMERLHVWVPRRVKAWIRRAAAARGVPEAAVVRHVFEWYRTNGGPLVTEAAGEGDTDD